MGKEIVPEISELIFRNSLNLRQVPSVKEVVKYLIGFHIRVSVNHLPFQFAVYEYSLYIVRENYDGFAGVA